jgi:putative restriction endonuclease
VKIYVGITDKDWYEQLKAQKPEEVNFWKPGSSNFKALEPNDMFLFKLHHPANFIVGGGFFVRFSLLPSFLAWQAFGMKNGTTSYEELQKRIKKYRSRNGINSDNAPIGCIILTEPFFFDEHDWIPVPIDWNPNIVQGKTYETTTELGNHLYCQIHERLQLCNNANFNDQKSRYAESLTMHRLGQGTFRIVVTEAYQRRCAITGEKTLPVLEAAHIKPFSENGPHDIKNGLLLRSDFHTLFDDGYITINSDFVIEVSKRLNEDYGNGKDYYRYHGSKLQSMPSSSVELPSQEYIMWHNEHCYKG